MKLMNLKNLMYLVYLNFKKETNKKVSFFIFNIFIDKYYIIMYNIK